MRLYETARTPKVRATYLLVVMPAKESKFILSNKNVRVTLPTTDEVGDLSEVPGKPLSVLFHPTIGQLMLGEVEGGDSSFNGNRTITRPGLPGVNVGGTTVAQFLSNFFFPSVPPAISLYADNSQRLFGAPNSVVLHWAVQRNTSPITEIEVNGLQQDPEQTSGTAGGAATQNASTRFYATVTSEAGESVSTYADVAYYHHRYWFTASENLPVLFPNDADLSANVRGYASREFASGRQMPLRDFTPEDEYIYFAYPAAWGEASFKVNGLDNTAYQPRQFQFTNQFGYVEPYYLYRSGNKASIPVNVLLS